MIDLSLATEDTENTEIFCFSVSDLVRPATGGFKTQADLGSVRRRHIYDIVDIKDFAGLGVVAQ